MRFLQNDQVLKIFRMSLFLPSILQVLFCGTQCLLFEQGTEFKAVEQADHRSCIEWWTLQPGESAVTRASKLSKRLGADYEVSAKDCKLALLTRLDTLAAVQTKNCGLVDAIQIV